MLTFKSVSIQLCVLGILTACQTINYTASCRVGDAACQRNQNARTLALIGHTDAATELMCSDTAITKLQTGVCTGISANR